MPMPMRKNFYLFFTSSFEITLPHDEHGSPAEVGSSIGLDYEDCDGMKPYQRDNTQQEWDTSSRDDPAAESQTKCVLRCLPGYRTNNLRTREVNREVPFYCVSVDTDNFCPIVGTHSI